MKKPQRIGIALVCMLVAFTHRSWNQRILFQGRSFFSPLVVKTSEHGRFHELVNGGVVHGRQERLLEQRRNPLSYYHKKGGAGLLFNEFGQKWTSIGGIGLGVGTLAGYLTPQQSMTFYEIDPLVVKLAENENYFSYIADARERGAAVKTVLGDARIFMARGDEMYDAIFLDAFQSAAIPTHLLTVEAISIYLRHLKNSGMIAFHVSNKNFNFAALLASQASHLGLKGFYHQSAGEQKGADASTWITLVKARSQEGDVVTLPHPWEPLGEQKRVAVWTDLRSDLYSLF